MLKGVGFTALETISSLCRSWTVTMQAFYQFYSWGSTSWVEMIIQLLCWVTLCLQLECRWVVHCDRLPQILKIHYVLGSELRHSHCSVPMMQCLVTNVMGDTLPDVQKGKRLSYLFPSPHWQGILQGRIWTPSQWMRSVQLNLSVYILCKSKTGSMPLKRVCCQLCVFQRIQKNWFKPHFHWMQRTFATRY